MHKNNKNLYLISGLIVNKIYYLLLVIVILAINIFINIISIDAVYSDSAKLHKIDYMKWTYWYSDNRNIILSTNEMFNKDITLTISNYNSNSTVGDPNSYLIRVNFKDEFLTFLTYNVEYNCKIIIDGKSRNGGAKKYNNNSFIISDPYFIFYLLRARTSLFHISLPEFSKEFTFSTLGFDDAYGKMAPNYNNRVVSPERSIVPEKINNFNKIMSFCFLILGPLFCIIAVRYQINKEGKYKEKDTYSNKGNSKNYHSYADKESQSTKYSEYNKKYRENTDSNSTNSNQKNEYNKSNDSSYSYSNTNNEYSSKSNRSSQRDIIKDAFQFFDLDPSANLSDVKKKRKFLLKAFHPDKYQDDPESLKYAEQKMKNLNYYFEILQNYFIKNKK